VEAGCKIQKKITPWKDMMENEELLQPERKAACPDLILVASLIDRPPNLVSTGADVMILKIFSPKNFAKKLAFLTRNKAKLKKS
jgi:hypothetical protein